MDLTLPQIESLAPDAGSVSAARKLGARTHWQGLGRSDDALWGQCKGSALYQVRVDLADLGSKCSCPSRKFPCKHALGLLMLAASEPAAAPVGGPLPGAMPIAAALDDVARALARNPWIERFGLVLAGVTPVVNGNRWHVRDAAGHALPLDKDGYWLLPALSGGMPLDLGAEWDGHRLRPLGAVVNERYCLV